MCSRAALLPCRPSTNSFAAAARDLHQSNLQAAWQRAGALTACAHGRECRVCRDTHAHRRPGLPGATPQLPTTGVLGPARLLAHGCVAPITNPMLCLYRMSDQRGASHAVCAGVCRSPTRATARLGTRRARAQGCAPRDTGAGAGAPLRASLCAVQVIPSLRLPPPAGAFGLGTRPPAVCARVHACSWATNACALP